MIRGNFLPNIWTEGHLSQDPSVTYLIRQSQAAGFEVLFVYPCYFQGWEMDEWGAIGTQDGQLYRIETSHGWWCPPVRIDALPILGMIPCLRFDDDEEG